MQLFESKNTLRSFLDTKRAEAAEIGLVPTMGALHEGHLELIRRALAENTTVVVSIYVNPTQFNNSEDLQRYPRNLESDLRSLKEVSEQLLIFVPDTAEMYPDGASSREFDFGGLERQMEGEFRPGHFDGVGTVVSELLRIVAPHRAYFGEKDYQQLLIIKKLVEIEALPVSIIGCPIVRETNGLAMSSRNERLPKRLRNEAGLILSSLKTARSEFGTKSVDEIKDWVSEQFRAQPEFDLEYFHIADAETLRPVTQKTKTIKYRAFIAVFVGGIRLIDNIALN